MAAGRRSGGVPQRARHYDSCMRTWSLVDHCWREGDSAAASVRWYDLCGGDDDALRGLAERYHLHPLTIDDCLSPYLHAPKLDDYGDYAFGMALAMDPETDLPAPVELNFFLGKDFLITYQDSEREAPEIALVVSAIEQGIALRPGADGLMYEILDRAVDGILPRITAINEQLDEIAESIVSGGTTATVSHRILELRRSAGRTRRLLAPMLAVALKFGRGELSLISPANVMYFRDVYDHLARVDLAIEELREDAEVSLNTYLSTLNNQMNEVMKVLAVVGALALPATVITGVFGTNFTEIPGLRSTWGFGAMVGALALTISGMAYYFHRRGWF